MTQHYEVSKIVAYDRKGRELWRHDRAFTLERGDSITLTVPGFTDPIHKQLASELRDTQEELKLAQEARYFWKGVALHLGYSGGANRIRYHEQYPPKPFRKWNCLFRLIRPKRGNNA